jgi:hypothetical protein
MSLIAAKSIGAGGKQFAERRSCVRRHVLKGAVVSFNRGCSAFECVVRNLSEDGAELSLCETFALPREFSLIMSGEHARNAAIRWRSSSAVGVSLVWSKPG